MRFPHYIRPNARQEIPQNILVVDTETHIEHGREKFSQTQTFRLGFAVFMQWDSRKKEYQKREYPFYSVDEFFEIVDSLATEKKKLYIYAHNASFDYAILMIDTYLSSRDYEIKMRVIDSVFIIKASIEVPCATNERGLRVKQSIVFSDTMNFYKMSLKKLGKIFGNLKMDSPDFENVSDNELMRYCRQDVMVLVTLLEKHIRFIQDNNLGNFKLTIASQAFTAYRHRFMDAKILVHTYDDIIALELDSYRGGRCEAFRLGKLDDIYKLDINSMYPYVMREHRYPTIPISKCVVSDISLDEVTEKLDEKLYVLAKCKLKLNEPAIAVRKDKLIFPVGNVVQTLTSPELSYILDNPDIGEIVSVDECAFYRQEPLFKKYVDFFYDFRQSTDNPAYKTLAKLFMNSLYGKFGQRSMSKHKEINDGKEELLNEMRELDTNTIVDLSNEKPRKIVKLGEKIYSITKDDDLLARDASPIIASTVTGYARCMLYDMIRKAGRNNVYYCDTDSVFVNRDGYERLDSCDMLSETELGKLKLEEKGRVEIIGAKNYKFNDEIKLKGIKKDAEKIEHNKYMQSQFITKNLRYRKNIPDGIIVVQPTTKTISSDYTKGIVCEDGNIKPFIYEDF